MVKEMHYHENTLFDLDLGVKVTQNVTQNPLHHVTYSPTKFEVATSYGSGGDTFTRNVTDGRTYARTHTQTDGRRTDFDTKLIYPFFLKKKAGITNDKYGKLKLHHNSLCVSLLRLIVVSGINLRCAFAHKTTLGRRKNRRRR